MQTPGRILPSQAALLAALLIITAHSAASQTPRFVTLYSFQGAADGSMPNGVLIGKEGQLYGTTFTGGLSECGYFGVLCGTVFELISAKGSPWTKTVIFNFNGINGAASNAHLTFGPGLAP